MINIISLLLLFTVGLNYYAVGDKLLTNLQDKFNEVKDLSAEFKQSTNGKSVISGKFFFKKKISLELNSKIQF